MGISICLAGEKPSAEVSLVREPSLAGVATGGECLLLTEHPVLMSQK